MGKQTKRTNKNLRASQNLQANQAVKRSATAGKKGKKKKKKKKKNTVANVISNLLIVVSLVVIAYTGYHLFSTMKEYDDGVEEYEDLREYVKKADKDKKQEGRNLDKCPIKVDFDALLKQNPDTVGWIYIEDSGINYPIVQNSEKGNDYYLHRTFNGENNFSGAIFLDMYCEPDFSSDNTIIYGHNLKNGEMFGHLKQMYDTNYNEKADYKKYPVVWILTPDTIFEYEVFAGKEISVAKNKDYYTVEFGSIDDFTRFLLKSKKESLFKTDVNVETEEPIITLSTCTSDSEDGRFVVQAIKIQEIDQE